MNYDLGVIVGRFQVPTLHAGHHHLITNSLKECAKTLIVIGVDDGPFTKNNPLDFAVREQMIKSYYPNVMVVPLKDNISNKAWSDELDSLIESSIKNIALKKVILWSGRKGFHTSYQGFHEIKVIETIHDISGTSIRAEDGNKPINSSDFRTGMVYSAFQNYPRLSTCVDIVVQSNNTGKTRVLMGCKKGETKLRFPGGFVEASDLTLEKAAARELSEEVGDIDVGGAESMKYIGSLVINDWRDTEDRRVITNLFVTDLVFGLPVAQDDLSTVRWVEVEELARMLTLRNNFSGDHARLAVMYLRHLEKETGESLIIKDSYV